MLNVFLASPTDVASERTAAEEVVASLNKVTGRRLGWHIELNKWEDTAPGFGRPQALINPMVDECDLFVGLLWERWGQPSGAHSSGFEEEFERARERRKHNAEPAIWLVFKEVESDKLRDPGEQLKKVVAFRSSQEALQEVLFKNVRDVDDWKTKLQLWLLDHILGLAHPPDTSQQHAVGVVPAFELPDTSSITSVESKGGRLAIPQQLLALSRLLSQSLQTRALGLSAGPESPMQEFEVARLYLLSATLIFHRYTRNVLGAHEINLLYKHREQLEATSAEEFQVLRAIVESASDTIPGWFWFRDMAEETVPGALVGLAVRDGSDEVRARALGLMTTARIGIPEVLWRSLPLEDESFRVREAAFDYIGSLKDERALSLLEKMAADEGPTLFSTIEDTRLEVLAGLDPETAFSEVVVKDQYIPDPQLKSLSAVISQIALLRGTESSAENIRRLSLEELIRRGTLPVPVAERLITDPSVAVRALSFHELAAKGELPDFDVVRKALEDGGGSFLAAFSSILGGKNSYPDADSIIATYYRTRSTEEILDAVDWFSLNGHLAYRALALDRFDFFSAQLRSDLASGFRRIKEESSRRREKELGNEWEAINASWVNLDEHIRLQFAEAALLGLAKNPQPSDADLVRPYLKRTSGSLLYPAVSIVAQVGNSDDTPALLKIAKESHDNVRIDAAGASLKLSTNPLTVATGLLLSENAELARVGYDWMLAQESSDVMDLFKTMLVDKDEGNRLRALHYISARLQGAELEKVLNEYIQRDTYYYNVVVWLDRLLYAPSPLREMFVSELKTRTI